MKEQPLPSNENPSDDLAAQLDEILSHAPSAALHNAEGKCSCRTRQPAGRQRPQCESNGGFTAGGCRYLGLCAPAPLRQPTVWSAGLLPREATLRNVHIHSVLAATHVRHRRGSRLP